MHPAAFGVMIAGFVFTYFSIPLPLLDGFDLLTDAVGFLLVHNGIRGLRRSGVQAGPAFTRNAKGKIKKIKAEKQGFGLASFSCFWLVFVSAVQLFLSATPLLFATALRAVLEVLLYLSLAKGFGKKLKAVRPGLSLLARAVFWLNALGTLAYGILLFTARYFAPFLEVTFEETVLLVFHIAALAMLLVLLFATPRVGYKARTTEGTGAREDAMLEPEAEQVPGKKVLAALDDTKAAEPEPPQDAPPAPQDEPEPEPEPELEPEPPAES